MVLSVKAVQRCESVVREVVGSSEISKGRQTDTHRFGNSITYLITEYVPFSPTQEVGK